MLKKAVNGGRRLKLRSLYSTMGLGKSGKWNSTLKSARTLVQQSSSNVKTSETSDISNFTRLVQNDLDLIKKHLSQVLVTTNHPVLKTISSFYFTGVGAKGKAFRPLLVLLLAKCMFPVRCNWDSGSRGCGDDGKLGFQGNFSDRSSFSQLDERRQDLVRKLGFIPPSKSIGKPESELNPFSDFEIYPSNIESSNKIESNSNNFKTDIKSFDSLTGNTPEILVKQKAIAEITEMIHTATLLHDDVIDGSDTRRNLPSIPATFGNKLAILGGDYLLSRASVALARLQNTRVVDLLSQVIADLVEGEIMQLRAPDKQKQFELDYYLQKCFSKTASLMAKSCQATLCVEPFWPNDDIRKSAETCAFEFGKNLGLAFQLMDDKLDFCQTSSIFGKPTGQDLKLGIATAPVLFASEQYPELKDMFALTASESEIDAKMSQQVFDCINKSDALMKTQLLAEYYANEAKYSLYQFPDSEARLALINICDHVTLRDK